nr:hypothetical protein CFP56_24632 [Quercus suber]
MVMNEVEEKNRRRRPEVSRRNSSGGPFLSRSRAATAFQPFGRLFGVRRWKGGGPWRGLAIRNRQGVSRPLREKQPEIIGFLLHEVLATAILMSETAGCPGALAKDILIRCRNSSMCSWRWSNGYCAGIVHHQDVEMTKWSAKNIHASMMQRTYLALITIMVFFFDSRIQEIRESMSGNELNVRFSSFLFSSGYDLLPVMLPNVLCTSGGVIMVWLRVGELDLGQIWDVLRHLICCECV